ncbi:hypothetical protein Vafri_17437 [Volvox africanus]|uniref:AAA+ ATPase domain-containing protein n=1 Tax=Volvox africanus TaxID=51714 RepID=A0A8J4BQC0_9CHLO|nr:hypothetical protein Vafri_17437 [Volvox africanus]
MASLSLGADATAPPATLQSAPRFDGAADTPSEGECRTVGVEEPASCIAAAMANVPRGASTSSPLPPNSSTTSLPAASGSTTVAQVADMQTALQAVRELVVWPVLYREDGAALGVRWPGGLLLHGSPGCGKTLLVQAVAAEAGASLHVVTAARVTGAYTGESERRLREAFARAQEDVEAGQVAVVFLDEVRVRVGVAGEDGAGAGRYATPASLGTSSEREEQNAGDVHAGARCEAMVGRGWGHSDSIVLLGKMRFT